jgi:hypothetical protein
VTLAVKKKNGKEARKLLINKLITLVYPGANVTINLK